MRREQHNPKSKNNIDQNGQRRSGSHTKRTTEQTAVWNAPVNPDAYKEREILQNVEDYDGAVIGNFCAARGKYLWSLDEDFSLFLLSIYRCSKEILDEIDDSIGRQCDTARRALFQKDLVYLLTQQFIAGTSLLQELAKEEKCDQSGQRIFYLPAMLEQHAVQVKIEAADIPVKKRKSTAKYQSLHLWLRLSEQTASRMPENLNLQIEGLLERYRDFR